MKNEKNYGRLDFDEKTSQLTKKEVLFDDSKDLSTNMLKSAFGSNFNTMFNEGFTDFPCNTKLGDFHEFTGVMPTPF